MNIPDFPERLDAFLKERGMTQADLAKCAGYTPRHVSKAKQQTEKIPEAFFHKICEALKITPEEFLRPRNLSIYEYFPVPLREASGSMGAGGFSGSRKIESYISLRKDFLLTKTSHLEALSFIHASGESMFPTIPPDAAVLIDESQREPVNKKIFYVMLNGMFLIKRLEVKEGKVKALVSDNGEIREEIGEQDELEILGRALLQQTML